MTRAALASCLDLVAFPQLAVIVLIVVATASLGTAAHLLDRALRNHTIAIAVIKLHIVRAISIVHEDLARVVPRAALAARLHLVTLPQFAARRLGRPQRAIVIIIVFAAAGLLD